MSRFRVVVLTGVSQSCYKAMAERVHIENFLYKIWNIKKTKMIPYPYLRLYPIPNDLNLNSQEMSEGELVVTGFHAKDQQRYLVTIAAIFI